MFSRVVMWPLRSGAHFSIASANASSCSGRDAAQRQLDADHLHVRLALAVDALLEAEADELVLGDVSPHEPGRLGVEVVELPLDDRDHVARDVLVDLGILQRADPPLAVLVLVADLELVFVGDPLRGGRPLHGSGLHRRSITQILTGFRAFTSRNRTRPLGSDQRLRCPERQGPRLVSPGQSTSVPSIRKATRTWARNSSRFSPRIAGADDVDRADVPQRALRLLQRLHRRVVAGRLRAPNQLDDLDYGHSFLLFVGFGVPDADFGARGGPCSVLAEIASRSAARCHGL